ncbi:hypothetical protein Ahy_B01g053114 [Arachis hypogaea]|uniref:UvrC family homology region profile domain-containing protein n=1 Tax=Arachis hypogaea TaxID=3818 RepID=A0A445AR40_ARAHY|nr:hypothetical protein Ahy_B01g053114 [Arachis hypogaea]
MADLAGGYSSVRFLKKDVYNYAGEIRYDKIADGDASAAIVYLKGKSRSDPMSRQPNIILRMLQNILEVMCNKVPKVVVIDGDKTMIQAVKDVFPNVTHCLCVWHIEKM